MLPLTYVLQAQHTSTARAAPASCEASRTPPSAKDLSHRAPSVTRPANTFWLCLACVSSSARTPGRVRTLRARMPALQAPRTGPAAAVPAQTGALPPFGEPSRVLLEAGQRAGRRLHSSSALDHGTCPGPGRRLCVVSCKNTARSEVPYTCLLLENLSVRLLDSAELGCALAQNQQPMALRVHSQSTPARRTTQQQRLCAWV